MIAGLGLHPVNLCTHANLGHGICNYRLVVGDDEFKCILKLPYPIGRKESMKEIGIYDFGLIQRHDEDYIEFSIRYSVGDAFWEVDGMGWISDKKTRYYLRNLAKNGKLSIIRDIGKAGIVLHESTMTFIHPELDKLTRNNIESLWKVEPLAHRPSYLSS